MAQRLMDGRTIARLSLDEIAWNDGPERKPLSESLALLDEFMARNAEWIIEGCYGDLVEAALSHCTELRFLNPGVEVCVEHCKRRPWEPGKFPTPDAQNAMLARLIEWVREYDTRDDEYGLRRHRTLFQQFTGKKREYVSIEGYSES